MVSLTKRLPLLLLLLAPTRAFVPRHFRRRANDMRKTPPPWRPTLSAAGLRVMRGAAPRIALHVVSAAATARPQEKKAMKIAAPLLLGVGTACVGRAYATVLKSSLFFLWQALPARFAALLPAHINVGPWLLPVLCTIGGALIGTLAKALPLASVADYISAVRGSPGAEFPKVRVHLLPICLLSLLTSSFGFSVGPEAPMVVVGSILGAALGRALNDGRSTESERTYAIAGAAGALTSFLGMPLAGAVFALELPVAGAAMSSSASTALSPAIAVTVAALLTTAALGPAGHLGGHFVWTGGFGRHPPMDMRLLYSLALPTGIAGAAVAVAFVAAVKTLRRPLARISTSGESTASRTTLTKALVGLMTGLLARAYPQSFFWGERSLQDAIDAQSSAPLLIPAAMARAAVVDVARPWAAGGSAAAAQVALAKFAAIALACAGGFPGGVIFPLFFAAGALAHGAVSLVGVAAAPSALVWCSMAAVQAAVTRTPLSTALMLGLSAAPSTDLVSLLPLCVLSSYTAVWTVQLWGAPTFFNYTPSESEHDGA